MQQQVYNTTSERQANDKRHSKRHSKFIRYSINNTLLTIQKNTLSLPEKVFSGRPILFSFENCISSVSSLDGNCEATGEALVNSLPGAFESYYKAKAKERQKLSEGRGKKKDVQISAPLLDDTGRVRDKLAEKAGAFSAYTATQYTTNQLNINTLRRGALKFWKQIKININVKH